MGGYKASRERCSVVGSLAAERAYPHDHVTVRAGILGRCLLINQLYKHTFCLYYSFVDLYL